MREPIESLWILPGTHNHLQFPHFRSFSLTLSIIIMRTSPELDRLKVMWKQVEDILLLAVPVVIMMESISHINIILVCTHNAN